MERDLELRLRARMAMIWLHSLEEDRSVPRIQSVAEGLDLVVFDWNCNAGFTQLTAGTVRQPGDGQCTNIDQALGAIGEYSHQQAVFIVRDFDLLYSRLQASPEFVVVLRRIKQLCRVLRQTGNTIVFLASTLVVPPELQDFLALVTASLPDHEERVAIIHAWIDANAANAPSDVDEETIHRAAGAAAGMTSQQIQTALAMSMVGHKGLTGAIIDDVLARKVEVVKTSEILEYVDVRESLEDVGGLAGIKAYIEKRSLALGPAAARYGLPVPKGILILGPPGTGKSLTARAAASELHMPLIRFDLGRIQASLVGQSEERMRRALAMAESQAPCVLWIDELEKAFAGATGPSGDSGVTQRLFGSLLTWMQDRSKPVFVVATANNVRQLPPEFLRKGRFDEIFFVDLPTPPERRAVMSVLLRKYGQDRRDLITQSLIAKLDRYTGAEMEYVIVEAMYEAFYDNQRLITVKDLEAVTASILPLADQMRAEIEALRRWGKASARPASGEPERS